MKEQSIVLADPLNSGAGLRTSTAVSRFLLLLGVVLLISATWYPALNTGANREVDAGLKRALISFGTARAINAIISVVQGTELAVQPAGVGLKFSPGQALHPVNELVGQFSHVMLAASIAFGIIKILVSISSAWVLSILISAAVVAWSCFRWHGIAAPTLLSRVLFILLLVRFAMPLAALGSEALYESFMQKEYVASQNALDGKTSLLGAFNTESGAGGTAKQEGFLERMKSRLGGTFDINAKLEQFAGAANGLVDHIVKLMALFILQTLVFPLIFIWGLSRICWAMLVAPVENPMHPNEPTSQIRPTSR